MFERMGGGGVDVVVLLRMELAKRRGTATVTWEDHVISQFLW